MRQLLFIICLASFIISCGSNGNKQKELDLKEKELALKERELALKEKDMQQSDIGNLITENAAGTVKLGMTVKEVRTAVNPMVVSRTSDGEGVALIGVNLNDQQAQGLSEDEKMVMVIYADEEDAQAPINEYARISNIEVWDKTYKTDKGVHVGMLLKDVENIYGKLTEVLRSEIESREYATFSNQPSGITFRVSYDAGKYVNGQNTSTGYNEGAYIYSISIYKKAE